MAHSVIYTSATSGRTFPTAVHSWDAVLRVALEMAGNEGGMVVMKEGKLKGRMSFYFITSHTHMYTHPDNQFNMFSLFI